MDRFGFTGVAAAIVASIMFGPPQTSHMDSPTTPGENGLDIIAMSYDVALIDTLLSCYFNVC